MRFLVLTPRQSCQSFRLGALPSSKLITLRATTFTEGGSRDVAQDRVGRLRVVDSLMTRPAESYEIVQAFSSEPFVSAVMDLCGFSKTALASPVSALRAEPSPNIIPMVRSQILCVGRVSKSLESSPEPSLARSAHPILLPVGGEGLRQTFPLPRGGEASRLGVAVGWTTRSSAPASRSSYAYRAPHKPGRFVVRAQRCSRDISRREWLGVLVAVTPRAVRPANAAWRGLTAAPQLLSSTRLQEPARRKPSLTGDGFDVSKRQVVTRSRSDGWNVAVTQDTRAP